MDDEIMRKGRNAGDLGAPWQQVFGAQAPTMSAAPITRPVAAPVGVAGGMPVRPSVAPVGGGTIAPAAPVSAPMVRRVRGTQY